MDRFLINLKRNIILNYRATTCAKSHTKFRWFGRHDQCNLLGRHGVPTLHKNSLRLYPESWMLLRSSSTYQQTEQWCAIMFIPILPAKFTKILPNLTSIVGDWSSLYISIKFLLLTCTFHSTAIFFYSVFLSYMIWRIWLFRIVPRMYPHEPKELPYWIPGMSCHSFPCM